MGGKQRGIIKLYDPVLGRLRAAYPAHEGFIAALAFAPHGQLLATSGAEGTIEIWSARELEVRSFSSTLKK